MYYVQVISKVFPLMLVLGLALEVVLPALAEPAQGTEVEGRISEEDGNGRTASATLRREPISPEASLTVLSEGRVTSERPASVERGLNGVATKLAFDLGLIHQREEDALGALDHVGITPFSGWTSKSECTPEVVYEVLAAARRAALAGRLSVSADGAEAIVRAAFAPCLSTRADVASEQTPFVAAAENPQVAGEAPVLVYEQAYAGPLKWLSPSFGGPVVVISPRYRRSSMFRSSSVFVRCPPWWYRPGFVTRGWPTARGRIGRGPWADPPMRVVRATPRFFAPPVPRFSAPAGRLSMPVGSMRGGLFRR